MKRYFKNIYNETESQKMNKCSEQVVIYFNIFDIGESTWLYKQSVEYK